MCCHETLPKCVYVKKIFGMKYSSPQKTRKRAKQQQNYKETNKPKLSYKQENTIYNDVIS